MPYIVHLHCRISDEHVYRQYNFWTEAAVAAYDAHADGVLNDVKNADTGADVTSDILAVYQDDDAPMGHPDEYTLD